VNTSPDLGDLLHDAVGDIEPEDRLDAIRARTASPARAAARPWRYAAGGVALAAAATVAGFAVLGDGGGATHDHTATASEPPGTQLVAVYFIGTSDFGDRLFREFDRVPAGDGLQAALDRIEHAATDPDYRTPWTSSSFHDVRIDDDLGTIQVEVGDADLGSKLAVQQVVYTLQAAAGRRWPVEFVRDGQRSTGQTMAQPMQDVLNLVSISDPAEGNEYSGSFTARGRVEAHSWVEWTLTDPDGRTVRQGRAPGTEAEQSFKAWETEVDLSGLRAGTYVFTTTTDTEAFTFPSTDTRTIIVR
jgi:hypothetical protein